MSVAQELSSPDEEARALFEAGRAAFAGGRFEEALERFVRAHELSGRPELLYNIGVSADRLRHDAQALAAFRAYLEAVPAADTRAEIEARIAILEQQLAERRAVAAPAPVPSADPPPPPLHPPSPIAARREPDRTGESLTIAGVTIAGLALVAAGVTGGLALGVDDSLTASCGAVCEPARLDELYALTVLTDVSFGLALGGAVLAGVGLALGVDGGEQPDDVALALVPTPGGAWLTVRGRLP